MIAVSLNVSSGVCLIKPTKLYKAEKLGCVCMHKTFQTEELTVQILCIGTDRSQQTVQTKIRLLLKKQSDQGLRCLPVHQHLLDALMQCYVKRFYF